MRIFLGLLLALNCFAQVPECKIVNLRTSQANTFCESGSSKIIINSSAQFNATESYHLTFNKALFNTSKTLIIKDKKSLKNILQIVINNSREIMIKSIIPNKTWIFEELPPLNAIFISIDGSVVIKGEIVVDKSLNIETKKLYLAKPFTIKEGIFRLKYQEGFIPRLTMPFTNAVENNFLIIKSIAQVLTPSKRRTPLIQIPSRKFSMRLDDFLLAYEKIFARKLHQDFPGFATKKSLTEKLNHIKSFILPSIKDNKKKGDLGEELYRLHIKKTKPGYEFKDPKIGLTSFDAIYFYRDKNLKLKEIIIAEVKYAKNGLPVLGIQTIEGNNWHQLSRPYVKNTLNKMQKNIPTKSIADEIMNHLNLIKLELAVFNPDGLELVIYAVGDMNKSFFD